MPDHTIRSDINFGDFVAPVIARVNRRAKRLIVKVDSLNGQVLVTAPSKRSLPEAIQFAKDRADWIAGQLDNSLRARPFEAGMIFPYRGENHLIVRDGGPRAPVKRIKARPPTLTPTLTIGGDAAHLNRRLTDWLQRQARTALTERTDYYCERLGKKRKALRIRDTSTRWGSCSCDGVVSFSWRLILAPPDILDYVAAHECMHLVHLNHSPAYWRGLATLGVDARAAGDWFKINGPALFTYGAKAITAPAPGSQ